MDTNSFNWRYHAGRHTLLIILILLACFIVPVGVFAVDTFINNHAVQPLQRSRLDSDADYRRGIEAQARGLVATFERAEARLPIDQAALDAWLKANPGATTLVQEEQYSNLQAQVQGDENAITRSSTDYDALVNNPDNQGLFTFDPNLPRSLP